MFTNEKRNRRTVNRTLGIQKMESRELMAADSFVSLPVTPPTAVVGFNDTRLVANSLGTVNRLVGFNDTISTATNLGTVNTAVVRNDSVGGSDVADFFRFRVGTSGLTNFQLGGMSRDVDIYITDSAGNRLGSGVKAGTGAENVSVNLTAGRDYFLNITPFGSGGVSAYQLQIHAPGQNNTMNTATNIGPVSSSVIRNGSVGGNDPVDYYRFSFTTTGRQQIQLSGMTRDLDIYVLDSAGNTIASGRNSSTGNEDFYITVVPNREYFLRVVPFGSSTAVSNYQLRLSVR